MSTIFVTDQKSGALRHVQSCPRLGTISWSAPVLDWTRPRGAFRCAMYRAPLSGTADPHGEHVQHGEHDNPHVFLWDKPRSPTQVSGS